MSHQNLELADWKLSAAIALVRYAAEDNDMHTPLSSPELMGLFELLNNVQALIKPDQGGNTK